MTAYYNENDPNAAQWLRNLIDAGHIASGHVDERDIRDVRADDLRGYVQCHFFAGIAGWAYALRLAGWPDDRPVWTGSCPCQPFSNAGRRRGLADERHLWPDWFALLRQRRPTTVLGEQVASKDGLAWFDLVSTDLENAGYAVAAADLCAAGVGAPHIRQRLWFVADADGGHTGTKRQQRSRQHGQQPQGGSTGDQLADRLGAGFEIEREQSTREERTAVERSSEAGDMGEPDRARLLARDETAAPLGYGRAVNAAGRHAGVLVDAAGEQVGFPGRARQQGSAPWADLEWLPCIDGKARPTQPGIFPLAHGVSGRVGQLRAYGNAIVPQVAAQFIVAADEAMRSV